MKKLTFLKNQIIAHLGVYDNTRIYENTISAIERAIKLNMILSIDVRMLKDGNLVLFSDSTLERLLHVEESIENITLNDLNYYAKYKIPTLEEALVTIQGKVPVIINIRAKSKRHTIESKIVNLFKKYPGEYTIQSKSLSQLKYIHKSNKDAIIGYVLNKKNYYDFIFFHDYDYVCIDGILVSEKQAKKFKEDHFLLGYGIKNNEQYSLKKNCYDALICDNVLDIKK